MTAQLTPGGVALHLGLPLRGAACARIRAPLWDADVHGETVEQREARHQRARTICGRCPARTACADVAELLGDGRARGIWAGRLIGAPRPVGRPPKTSIPTERN